MAMQTFLFCDFVVKKKAAISFLFCIWVKTIIVNAAYALYLALSPKVPCNPPISCQPLYRRTIADVFWKYYTLQFTSDCFSYFLLFFKQNSAMIHN